jgi:hypothetical protein
MCNTGIYRIKGVIVIYVMVERREFDDFEILEVIKLIKAQDQDERTASWIQADTKSYWRRFQARNQPNKGTLTHHCAISKAVFTSVLLKTWKAATRLTVSRTMIGKRLKKEIIRVLAFRTADLLKVLTDLMTNPTAYKPRTATNHTEMMCRKM